MGMDRTADDHRRVLWFRSKVLTDPAATPWWTWPAEEHPQVVGPVETRSLYPEELSALGLSPRLIRDGRIWQRDRDAAASSELGTRHASRPRKLLGRAVDLARRSAEEHPGLWVMDPDQDWHIGAGQLTWPLPPACPDDQALRLRVPLAAEDAWPWSFVPERDWMSDDDWSVPLPRDLGEGLGRGTRIEAATAAYVRAMSAASGKEETERAWRCGRQALRAMHALLVDTDGEFQVGDVTGRVLVTDEERPARSSSEASGLLQALRAFAAAVPKPPVTPGRWSTEPPR